MTFSKRSARISLVIALAGAMGVGAYVAPSLHGQTPAPAAGAAAAAPVDLDKEMGAMSRAFRRINSQHKDKAQNEATLAQVVLIQQATLNAKAGTPAVIAKMTGDEKTKAMTEYRTQIASLLQLELDLEKQLLAGDNTKAAETVAAMDAAQKAGHAKFRPPQ